MIYLDAAATSLQKPPSVARAVAWSIGACASVGRGGHAAAERAAQVTWRLPDGAGGSVRLRTGAGRLHDERHARPESRDRVRRSGRAAAF